jgi:hypothetical protein
VKKLLIATVAFIALTATAHAFGDIVLAPPEKAKPDRGNGADPNYPFPFDAGRMNESPIRGRGQIHVNHNMAAPDDTDRKLTEALWLLQDNSWTCYKPKMSRR